MAKITRIGGCNNLYQFPPVCPAFVSGLNTPEIKDELEIPVEVSAIAPIIVGVLSGMSAVASRKEPQILSWK
jgi:hypothetical protein